MGFNDFSSGVKLNNIKTYNGVNATNTTFKNTFYSDIKDIDYSQYEEIDYNEIDLEKGIETAENHIEWYEEVLEWDKKIKATKCVVATTLLSGVLKIVEYAEDGLTWLGGMATSGVVRLVGQEELAEKIETATMDEIARDKVGELNKAFYENTEIGRSINEASAMKYDSELAKGIQNVTTEVVIIAGATAATVVTGGAAAPLFVAGFAIGAGQSAEKKFQDKENRNFWKDSVEIGVDGTIKGLSTMAYGKAGAAAFNGVKAISSLGFSGIKEVGKTTIKSFSKDAIKTTLKNTGKKVVKNTAINTLKDKDTWLETGTVLLDDVKTGIQTGEWNVARMLGDVALIYGENYLGNLAGGLIGDVIGNSTKNSQVEITEKIFDETTAKLDEVTEKIFDETTEKIFDETTAKLDQVTEKLTETIQRSPRQIAALDSFSKVMQIGSPSDERLVKLLYRTFDESISNGNYESLLLLEKFVGLKSQNPGLTIEIDTGNNSYWQKSFSKIVIGKDHLDWMDSSTISHELGHCLFDSILDGKVPENWDAIVSKARVVSSTDDAIVGLGDQLIKKSNDTYWRARGEFIQGLQNNKGLTFSEYTDQLTEMYNNLLNKGETQSLINFCKSEGYPEYVINNLELGSITGEELAVATTNFEIYKVKEGIERTQDPGLGAVSDIMDAVYEGNNTDLNGKSFSVTYQHGKEYYLNGGEYYQFHEVIAEFTELKISGDQASLNLLKNLFGDEFYNCLEDTYMKFIS